MSEETEEFRIGPDIRAVSEMRRAVHRMCRDAKLSADVCDTAVLLTSETLTNAIVHGGTAAHLVVRTSAGGVRVEVTDGSRRPPVDTPADTDATHGRGVGLINSLATRWGVRRHPPGKTVWFEVAPESRPCRVA
ncbi:ATP-binding protein [Frankia sp. AgKG'84/4]|uniref:ATP-binding protein n=1 Tax=Frankia sp. AgKG'84/4 TaxID=573490 RepID=UPI00200DC5EC|nr:ATP-binding protein [Frankia sp. AgKG'84/4]MCL9794260.1 ATP-binding protein [Frankia sp. AgKG'84/4]